MVISIIRPRLRVARSRYRIQSDRGVPFFRLRLKCRRAADPCAVRVYTVVKLPS